MRRSQITSVLLLLPALGLGTGGAELAVTVKPLAEPAAGRRDRIGRAVEIGRAAARPVIDGRLDDACWRDALVADNFLRLGSDLPAAEQTVARLTCDDRALYLAFVCSESRMDRILAHKTKHDDGVWQDDCVEVFLDVNHDHLTYFQFIVNSIGTRHEARFDHSGRLDAKWDVAWEAKTAVHPDHWDVEIAIPFESLGAAPGCWGMNLCREQNPAGELSCWAPQHKRFAAAMEELALFNDVVFAGVPLKVRRLLPGNGGWGENLLQLEIENRTDAPATWEVRVAAGPTEAEPDAVGSRTVKLGPRQARAVEVPYVVERLVPGLWSLDVSVRDPAADRVWSVGGFPFEVRDAAALTLRRKVVVGPDYVLPARFSPVIGSVTLKQASCRIRVSDSKGQLQGQASFRLFPDLHPCREADVLMDISGLPAGRYVVAAQVVDAAGSPVTDRGAETVVKIPGPFEDVEAGPVNLVKNPSFEVVDDKGSAAGWSGCWWAAKASGLAEVAVKDFLALDATVARDGRRSTRIKSTRGGAAASSEVLTVRTEPIHIKPGVSYELALYWKSDSIEGIGKLWAQTPKRQFLFKGTINGTNPDWLLHRTTFTPDDGETWCRLNFSLHGKNGTLWIDQIVFAEEAPTIARIIAPNAFRPEGICLLGGNATGRGLRLALEATAFGSGQRLGAATAAVEARTVRFSVPGMTLDRKARLAARLLDRSGRALDEKTAIVFGAPQ